MLEIADLPRSKIGIQNKLQYKCTVLLSLPNLNPLWLHLLFTLVRSLESWVSCFWVMHQCGCGLLAWPFQVHMWGEVSHVQFKVSKHSLFCSNNRCCYISPVIIVQKQNIMLNLRADLALLLWGCKVKILVLIYQTCESLLNNQPPSKFIYLGRSPRLLIGVH